MHNNLDRFGKAAICFVVVFALFFGARIPAHSTESDKSELAKRDVAFGGILQRLKASPTKLPDGRFYVPATLATMQWGYIPNRDSKPILTVIAVWIT